MALSGALLGLLLLLPVSLEARLLQAKEHTGKKVDGSLFSYLLKEWKEVPDEASFVKGCTGVVSKLLPQLRAEYTARQVPKVLFHECNVYSTKYSFKVENGTLRDAASSCRYCASRLGAEFLDEKPDYEAWCGDVHSFLSREYEMGSHEEEREKLIIEQKALREQLEKYRREYDIVTGKNKAMEAELGKLNKSSSLAECCPAGCRQC